MRRFSAHCCVNVDTQVGQVCIMVHSGSRGLGHQVATDALTSMERAMARDKVQINDRQLACALIQSSEGQVSCNFFASSESQGLIKTRRTHLNYLHQPATAVGLEVVCH